MAVQDLSINDEGKAMKRKADSGIVQVANSALTAAANMGDMHVVSNVLSTLSQAEIQANLESIRLIILTLGKAGDCESILAMLNRLRGHDIANENDVVKERYDIEILDILPRKYIPVLDKKIYSAAVTSSLKNDKLDVADEILQFMSAKDISLTQSSLKDVILEYCRMATASLKEEYKATRLAKQSQLVVSTYQYTVEPIQITSHARSKAALALLKAVKKPSYTLLSSVTKACAVSGLWQEARSLLRRIHRAAIRELKEGTLTTVAELPKLHRSLLKFCAKGGHITHALNYADDIQYLAQQILLHGDSFMHKKSNNAMPRLVSLSSTLLSDAPTKERKPQIKLTKAKVPRVLGRPIGLTGRDWKLLLIAAWRGGHWKVCVGTLPFIQPYVEETHPRLSQEFSEEDDDIRKPSILTLNRKYSQLESAITAAALCFENRGQYAWAIRAIDDWIEWSGRSPPRQAVIAACRAMAKRYRGTEVLNLVSRVMSINDPQNTTIPTGQSMYSYEKAIYVESINALHRSGLYDDADILFAEGSRNGHLASAVVQNASAADFFMLDLHSMSASVAHAAVRVSIQQEMSRLQTLNHSPGGTMWSKDIFIITGRGLRSGEKFKPVLRPEVQRMLTEEFFPPIGSSTVPGNLGALLVRSEEVATWLSHQQQQKSERLLLIADALRGISSGARLERAILSSGNRLEQALRRRIQNSQQDQ
jgi:hypothetical protein